MTPEEMDRQSREFARGMIERHKRVVEKTAPGILHILQPEMVPKVDLESLSPEERSLVEEVYANFRRFMKEEE